MDIDRLQGREDVAELLEQLSVLTLRHLTDHRELSFTAAATLARLDRAGPARLTALAAAEGVTQPSMTQLVQRLERQGLVTRVSDPDDGRVALIAVTDEGRALLAAHKQARRDRLTDLLATLSEAQAASLIAALPAVRQLLRNAARSRTPSGTTS
ncbi:MAG TPA: MarR family transcriptional regulator [Amycolatopsis sp.]|uniref:MarR family winged helix-turn-helix transcriptional regulator n=1 Tax=Amycolatopsis sp. TaxID=37632 RepID=UPI002B49DBC6|nr:MarR family transcriptional regulator [Amycolatopsis sp.]HKS47052.1 MarR family transcriptional regulator [Amycolatopsis sp.]